MAEHHWAFDLDATLNALDCKDRWPSTHALALSRALRTLEAICHPNAINPEGRDFTRIQDQLADHAFASRDLALLDSATLKTEWDLPEIDLAERLQEKDYGSRARAAAILGVRRKLTDGTLSQLLLLLHDGRVVVRAMALFALREQLRHRTLQPGLEAELLLRSRQILREDRSYLGRKAAAQTLGRIGFASAPAARALRTNLVEVLVEALKDSDKRVRIGAVEGLGFLGPDARGALLAIEQCQLEDSYRGERIRTGAIVRSAAIVRIEGHSERSEEHRSKIISAARFGSESSTRKFALETLLDLPIERPVVERVIIEALFLDDDRKNAEFAKEQAESLLAHETVIRLGILDVPI